jgi:hypothetical protein
MLMMAPPDSFDSLVGRVETIEIFAVSFMSIVIVLLVVVAVALHQAGATIRQLLDTFK